MSSVVLLAYELVESLKVVDGDLLRLDRAVKVLDITAGARVPPRALIFRKHSGLHGFEKPLQGPS